LGNTTLNDLTTPNIRLAAMLADSITIDGKSLISFGSGAHCSIRLFCNFS